MTVAYTNQKPLATRLSQLQPLSLSLDAVELHKRRFKIVFGHTPVQYTKTSRGNQKPMLNTSTPEKGVGGSVALNE